MRREATWRRYVRLWGPNVSADIDDEMECHVDLRASELERRGLTRAQARARALEEFGDMTRAKAECRTIGEERVRRQRRAEWWDTVRQDVVYAVRALRRNPGFTVVAVLALAVGIGANAAVFALVDAAIFRPLPVRAPEELVAIYGELREPGLLNVPYPAHEVLREQSAFADVATFTEKPASLLAGDEARVVWAHLTSDNYFSMLGARAARGRYFRVGELREPVVVLSDALWRAHFQADPSVLGRMIELNGYSYTVIGVAPPEFQGTRSMSWAPQLWLPAGMYERIVPGSRNALQSYAGNGFTAVGRLRRGTTPSALDAALVRAAERVKAEGPPWLQDLKFTAFENRTSINPWLAPPAQLRKFGRLFVLGSALVLLIACADVANLLLARQAGRRSELALRISLGAGRRRLIRQLLTENLVLAVLAGVVALPLAYAARYLTGLLQPPTDHAIIWRATLDARVLGFMAVAAVLAGVAAGLMPAIRGGRWDLGAILRTETGGVTGRRSRLRNGLVVAQIAISVVVLSAAGLFARNLRQAHAMHPGFDVNSGIVFTVQPRLLRGYDDARIAAMYRELVTRLRALPGVRAVTRATSLPLDSNNSATVVRADGSSTDQDGIMVDYVAIDPGYYAVMGTPLVAGREFVENEDTALRAVVINAALAERLWPGENAVGKRVREGGTDGDVYEVIGVAQTGRYSRLSMVNEPSISYPLQQTGDATTTLLLRSTVDPAVLYPQVRRVVRELEPRLPLVGLKTLREHIAVSYSAAEGGAVGAAAFGVLALLLAAAGVYGVISYAVAQRRREIGIRMALGAARADVIQLVVRGSGMLAGLGIVIGCTLAAMMGFALRGITYDGRGHDLLTLGAVCVLLAVVALFASWLPAQRAARVDPTLTMRL